MCDTIIWPSVCCAFLLMRRASLTVCLQVIRHVGQPVLRREAFVHTGTKMMGLLSTHTHSGPGKISSQG